MRTKLNTENKKNFCITIKRKCLKLCMSQYFKQALYDLALYISISTKYRS